MPATQIVTSLGDGGWVRREPARPLAMLAPAGYEDFGAVELGVRGPGTGGFRTGRREASERLTAWRGSSSRWTAWLGFLAQAGGSSGPRPQREAGVFGQTSAVTGGGPGDAPADRAVLRTLFEAAVAGLTPGEREVIELELRQGLAPHEVAAVLGVPRGHALRLQAKARERLTESLSVLLVSRAGRAGCETLGSLLTGWDGQLTTGLQTRVGRHIDRCATCAATRVAELRPARLLDLPPGAALAAGGAESLRLAPGAPGGLRARTMSLAAGRGPAAAGRAAVLARAGTFGARGFPRPADPASAGLAAPRWASGPRPALRASRPGAVAVAAVAAMAVLAMAALAVAMAALAVATAALAAGPGPAWAAFPHSCPASMVSPRGSALAACTSWTRPLGGRPAGEQLTEPLQPLRSWIGPNRLR